MYHQGRRPELTRVHVYLFINMINLVLHLMRHKVWRYGDVVGVLKHKKILASADLRGPQARVVKTKKILIAMLYGLMLEIIYSWGPFYPTFLFRCPWDSLCRISRRIVWAGLEFPKNSCSPDISDQKMGVPLNYNNKFNKEVNT